MDGSSWSPASLAALICHPLVVPRRRLPEGLCHEGRAGFFVALARAVELLLSGQVRRVLVGAVDSLCDPGSLEHLLAKGRLLCSSVREGILPGEGAGFVLLTRASALRRDGPRVLGRILALAVAKEPRHRLQSEPSLAEGLTSAFRQLHAHPVAGSRRVAQVLSCQTGEAFWGHEFNRAYLRNALLMPEPLVGHLVAESLGDVGAGAGVIQLGHALHVLGELGSGHGQAPRALVYGCSDEGQVEGKGVVRFMDVTQHNGNTFNTAFMQDGGTGWAYGDDPVGESNECPRKCGKDKASHRILETPTSQGLAMQLLGTLDQISANPKMSNLQVFKPRGGYMIGVLLCRCQQKIYATMSGSDEPLDGFKQAIDLLNEKDEKKRWSMCGRVDFSQVRDATGLIPGGQSLFLNEVTKQFHHGEVVPSCATCQIHLTPMLCPTDNPCKS